MRCMNPGTGVNTSIMEVWQQLSLCDEKRDKLAGFDRETTHSFWPRGKSVTIQQPLQYIIHHTPLTSRNMALQIEFKKTPEFETGLKLRQSQV